MSKRIKTYVKMAGSFDIREFEKNINDVIELEEENTDTTIVTSIQYSETTIPEFNNRIRHTAIITFTYEG